MVSTPAMVSRFLLYRLNKLTPVFLILGAELLVENNVWTSDNKDPLYSTDEGMITSASETYTV